MKGNPTRPRLSVTTGGKGVVAHAGARLLCDLADEVGLTARLSAAMAPSKCRRRGWDRGRVLVDLAVALAVASAARGVALEAGGHPLSCFGELGLTGELRPVAHADRRLAEATKFGLTPAIHPGMQTTIREALSAALAGPGAARRRAA